MPYSVVVVALDYLFIIIQQTLVIILVNMEENRLYFFEIYNILDRYEHKETKRVRHKVNQELISAT